MALVNGGFSKKFLKNLLLRNYLSDFEIIMPPFEEVGVYCFGLVGPLVGQSVDHIFVCRITQKVFQVSP